MTGDTHVRLVSLKELLSRAPEEIEFLVEGLLIKSGLGLLAGKPKAGKSTLARVLAFSLAHGNPFLGFPTRKGGILYYALEEKESEVRRHFEAMGADGSEQITISTQYISPQEFVKTLRADIKLTTPSLVIIDPMFRAVHVKDSNSYAEVNNALEPLMRTARETGTHILCVHHLGKSGGGADSILGSTAIRAAFDVNILLNRTEQHRTIQSECRYGEDLEESIIVFDDETKIARLGEVRQDSDGDRISRDILEFLNRSDGPQLQKSIDTGVSGKTSWKRYGLRSLFESNQVTRSGSGQRGDPYLYSASCTLVPDPAQEHGNNQLEF